MKKAIFLFNRSRYMLQPWLEAGYECWTFDGQLPDGVKNPEPGLYEVGMWFDASATSVHASDVARIVGGGVKFIASFAECTYLTTTGARWLYHPDDKDLPIDERRPHPAYPNRRRDMDDAVKLAKFVELVEAYCHIVNSDFPPGLSPGCLRTRRAHSFRSCGAITITPSTLATMADTSRKVKRCTRITRGSSPTVMPIPS